MLKKTLKFTLSLILLTGVVWLLYSYVGYRIVRCDKDELVIASPADQWIKAGCYDGTHVLTSTGDYKWKKSDKEVFLNARGHLDVFTEKNIFNKYSPEPLKEKGLILSRGVFIKTFLRKLINHEVKNLNKDLEKELGRNSKYETIYFLRVFSSAGFPYDLFFYIQDSKPEYIYACIDYCHLYPPEIIRIETLNKN